MRHFRRTLRVLAFVFTILIGIIALALIVSQTPWFHERLRRYVVREGNQYLNGQLSIGQLGGNLFYGIQLRDVSIDVDGQHIITLPQVELRYSATEIIARGVVIERITLVNPTVYLSRDRQGWNVARLPKRQRQEANRQGPGRPVSMPDMEIENGQIFIDDRAPSGRYTLPKQIAGLNVKAGFLYEPVHYSLTLDNLSMRATGPDLTLEKLSGRFGERDDRVNVEKLTLKTAESEVTIDGAVENYLKDPTLQMTVTSRRLSLPEFARVLPALGGYILHPELTLKAAGRQRDLAIDLKARSEAGAIDGRITADLQAPDFAAKGAAEVDRLDLAPLLKDPAQRSDISGHATFDLKMDSQPASAPATARLHGRYAFRGPRVVALGYTASDVNARGTIEGRRVTFDGAARAYGATAAAKGFIATPARAGDPVRFDVAGRAAHIDLRNLPPNLNVPKLATDLNASAFHVGGQTRDIRGDATLEESTVEGATIAAGTTAQFGLAGGDLTYAARGGVRNANLYRIGHAANIAALAKPEYDSRINGQFDLTAAGTALPEMKLDATATLVNSEIMGGTIPELAGEVHLANGGIQGRANGELRGFDPARVSGNDRYKGTVNATVNAAFGVRDPTAPITPEAVTADGRITVTDSTVAGLKIDNADIQGEYANDRGDIRALTVKGPAIDVQASGPIALDRTGSSNVKYHVVATDLESLGKLVDQPLGGSATLDGTLTGNAATLKTSGTLDGSNLSYKETNKALDLNSTYNVSVPDLQFARARVEGNTTGTFVTAGGVQIDQIVAGTTYENQKLDFRTHIAQRATPGGPEAEAAAGQKPSPVREVDATGSVIFHPDHQELHLPFLAVRTQGIEWKSPPGNEAAVRYGGNRVQIENLKLVNADQSLDVSGAFATGGDQPVGDITVKAQNVDIAQLEKLAMQERGFTGRLNADARISGTANAPAIDGRVQIANGGFQQFKYESLSVNGNYTADAITLDARVTQSPGVTLTAVGTLPITALKPNPPGTAVHVAAQGKDAIDLRIQSSKINLGIVQAFTNQVTNVKGTMEADVRVTGSGEDPHLGGYLTIDSGAFAVVPASVSFTGLTTRIDFKPDTIRISQFQIKDEHGNPLTIGGELAIHERQFGAVNVSLTSDDFKVIDNELGNVHLQTQLKLAGDVRHPKLMGDVRFDSARLQVDQILTLTSNPYSEEALPDVVSAESTISGTTRGADDATKQALERGRQIKAEMAPRQEATAPTVPAPSGGLLSALALDVHFIAPDNLVLRGDDLRPGGPTAMQIGNVNITVGSDSYITKQPAGPITIRGTVDTVRGFYEFQGRRFTVQRGGTLKFLGLPQINPTVDVDADRLIPNTGVTAHVHVTGTLRAPELRLTSDPPLDEADILSLIVFNRPVNELGTGERASLAETAGGIASGFLASSLGKSIGKALDVDLFEITTTDPETGESAGGITLGKQLSDKAFIRFRQQFGQRTVTEFMIEYQLTDFLRLQASAAPETSGTAYRLTQRRVERGGVDLIFLFSY
jgi:hypothetical protein